MFALLAHVQKNQSLNLAVKANEALKDHLTVCHPDFTIAYDNIDFAVQRKNMTMGKQNRDLHWVNHQMFFNRVSAREFIVNSSSTERSSNGGKHDLFARC